MQESRPVLIGESFVGEGGEAAHINTVLGTLLVAGMLAARHAPANPFFTLA